MRAAVDEREQRWVDRKTRALYIDMNIFNANIGYLHATRLSVELLQSGGVIPTVTVWTVRAFDYNDNMEYLRAAMEGTVRFSSLSLKRDPKLLTVSGVSLPLVGMPT